MNRTSSILFSSEFHVGYRYAFNGKETETTVNTGAYDFGARMYDGRLGRWWSVDALTQLNCSSSTYCSSVNSPIALKDGNGRNWFYYQAENDDSPRWYWHSGSAIVVRDKSGKEVMYQSEIQRIVVFTVTGKNSVGANIGKLEVMNQNEVIISSNAGSGYHRAQPISYGIYVLDTRNVRKSPDSYYIDNKGNPCLYTSDGMQKLPTSLTSGNQTVTFGGWGKGRIRIYETNYLNASSTSDLQEVRQPDRGLYLHGRLKQGPLATEGCVAEEADKNGIQPVFNLLHSQGGIKQFTYFVVQSSSSSSVESNGRQNEISVNPIATRPAVKL
ncbi:MAG: hypothetical protein RL092_1577 [Bacteroidota bacterium]|jgi:RHS repeat-associated protein